MALTEPWAFPRATTAPSRQLLGPPGHSIETKEQDPRAGRAWVGVAAAILGSGHLVWMSSREPQGL